MTKEKKRIINNIIEVLLQMIGYAIVLVLIATFFDTF